MDVNGLFVRSEAKEGRSAAESASVATRWRLAAGIGIERAPDTAQSPTSTSPPCRLDILVSHPETDSMYRLEVKTALNSKPWRSKRFGNIVASWPMGDKHEKNVDRKLFYCFVGIAENTQVFDFFVVPSVVVAKFVTESHRYWLAADPTHRDTTMRLFMLGNQDDHYPIEMPAAEDYRARWDMLK
jgi:hypothetical protein